jgi:hypothetical protein
MQTHAATMDPGALVTNREAGEILGVTPQRVRQLIGEGALVPVVRRSRLTLLDAAEVGVLALQRGSLKV